MEQGTATVGLPPLVRRPTTGIARLPRRVFGAALAVALTGLVVSAAPAEAMTVASAQQVPGTVALSEVACPTTSTCVAVGEYGNGRNNVGVVVAITNGVAGSAQTVPGASYLFGIACADASSCVAVGGGSAGGSTYSGVVVPITDGTAGPAAAVAGIRGSNLEAVTCMSSTSCLAVGSALMSSGYEGAVVPRRTAWQVLCRTQMGAAR